MSELKARSLLPVYCAGALLVAGVAAFHIFNRGFFPWDPMDYISTTQRAYKAYREQGIWPALLKLYDGSAWKPILHPALALPALILLKGRVLGAIGVMNLTFYAIFLAAISGILLEFLPPLETSISLILIGASPVILPFAFYFCSEIYFLAALACLAFCLLRSGFLVDRRWGLLAGISLGFAACFRPVETVLLLSFPLLSYLLAMKRRQLVSTKDLLWALISLGSSALVFGFAYRSGRISLFPLLLPALGIFHVLAAVFYLRNARGQAGADVFGFLTISQWMALLWLAPSVGNLRSWFTSSTWGAGTDFRPRLIRWEFIKNVFAVCGGFPITCLVALGLAGYLGTKARQRFNGRLALVIAVSAWIPVLTGMTTQNPDIRYYLGIFVTLEILALAFALSPRWPMRRIRLALVGLLAASLFSVSTAFVLGAKNGTLDRFSEFSGGYSWMLGIWTRPEPIEHLFDKISEDSRFAKSFFLILPLVAGDDPDLAAEQHTLQVIASERGLPWSFDALEAADGEQPIAAEARQIETAHPDYLWVELPAIELHIDRWASKSGLFLIQKSEEGLLPDSTIMTWTARNGHPGRVLIVGRDAALSALRAPPGTRAGRLRKTL